jgi:hypothetical protein
MSLRHSGDRTLTVHLPGCKIPRVVARSADALVECERFSRGFNVEAGPQQRLAMPKRFQGSRFLAARDKCPHQPAVKALD